MELSVRNSLAYAEIRHSLATLLLELEYEILEESRGWIEGQSFYLLWERPPLMARLKKRERV